MGLVAVGLLAFVGFIVTKGPSPAKKPQVTVPTTTTPTTVAQETTTTTTEPVPSTTAAPPAETRPIYAVSDSVVTLSEPGKYLCAPYGSASGCIVRSMPLYIYYPAAGSPGGVVNNAAPIRKGGPFPLVIFGNGYLESVGSYSVILDFWASRGYIVAAPQFPLSQTDSVGGPWEADILNQPSDMSAAVTYMVNQDHARSSEFFGLVNTQEIAATGQSDGADAALAVGYNSCCTDTRIKAVISLSGAELSSYPGKYFVTAGPPLLVVQGTADEINQPSGSQEVFASAHPPKYFETLIGADHLDGYQQVDPYSDVVRVVTGSFLDYYLKGESGALKTMNNAGNVAGVASLS